MIKQAKRKIRKMLINAGLKKSLNPAMETSEGHLGGYILNQAAAGTWCPEIWDWAIKELGVESMLDVGCGLGYSMEYFAKAGVELFGVDGSPSAIKNNVMPAKHLHQHDFSEGPWQPERKFDLLWSSEFLEHVDQEFEPNFFATFSAATKYLMVTFAVPGQGGHHHVNEQPKDYWLERFASQGFHYEEELTLQARSLLPQEGLLGMQFRGKGLVFSK